MSYLSDEFIDRVRAGNDIIDVVSEYVSLKQSGRNYKGLCPFHEEKTPSFVITPDKQLYHCFGCGAGGNVFNFIMEIENLEFIEAVKMLAERIGLALPQEGKLKKEKVTRKKEIYEIHDWATKFFSYLLTETEQGADAYNYLQQRDIKKETIEKFQLGYAPDSWQALFNFLNKKGYSAKRIHQTGLVIPRKKGNGYYDRFRNRVIFTICNARGQVIGFGGRVLDGSQPKYLNSPDTPIFDKGNNLYGLNLAREQIRKSGSAIIVEGYTDVIMGYQSGIKNIVASLGTSLTKKQAKLLNRYAERVYIAYDGDTAGESATLRGLDILKEVGVEVYVVDLPAEVDPDDLIRERGRKHFESLIEEAVPLIEFKIDCLLKKKELNKIESKVKVVEEVIPVLAEIDNEIERAEYIKRVAQKIDTEVSAIKSHLKNYLYQKDKKGKDRNYKAWNNKHESRSGTNKDDADTSTDEIDNIYLESAKKLLKLMLNANQIMDLVKDELEVDDFIIEKYKTVARYVFNSEGDDFELQKIFDQIDDPEIKNLITELSVAGSELNDSVGYQREMAKGYIKKIKEYYLKMKKEKLEVEMQECEANGDFAKLNQLLREYQELINNPIIGREGE